VHNANNLGDKRDGPKVGGHQASCASITAVMAALSCHALHPQDKVVVKPPATAARKHPICFSREVQRLCIVRNLYT